MTIAKLLPLALVLGASLISTASMASVVIGGKEYADKDINWLRASCAGLQAQSNQSLTYSPPEIEDSADPASYHNLSQLPFTVRDCRDAGLL